MTSPDLSDLADLARRIALEAGALLLDASGSSSRQTLAAGATRKSSRTDLATEADRASETLLRAAILRERPDDGVLGEEEGATEGRSGLTWVVDPLDGTTNFVYGFPGWAVSVAVADGDGALVGVVHDPVRGETFEATRGGGAFLDGERLAVRTPPALGEALVGTGFSYTSQRRHLQAVLLPMVLPAVRDIRRAGAAALDLCSVGAGRLDAYYEAGLKPWDRAAGLLVALEAGARFVELDDVIDTATLVVAPGGLLEELASLLTAAGQAGS